MLAAPVTSGLILIGAVVQVSEGVEMLTVKTWVIVPSPALSVVRVPVPVRIGEEIV